MSIGLTIGVFIDKIFSYCFDLVNSDIAGAIFLIFFIGYILHQILIRIPMGCKA